MTLAIQKTQDRINKELYHANTTKSVVIDTDALSSVPFYFKENFGTAPAIVIADTNTFKAAGKKVHELLKNELELVIDPFIFDDPSLYAEYKYAEQLEQILSAHNAIPIAVGSGTINDVTKLAAHHCDRQYMSVATAASMDGYTAYGASITYQDFKQTFFCPAPRAVIVDLNIIAAAPKGMNASGYADLLAKIPAGADWILADALEIEAITQPAWSIVQDHLRQWTSNPDGVREGTLATLAELIEGLIMSGLAMQKSQSSRPASGADHQFSHLWDNQHHTFNGVPPSHGFKVAIGSLASEALYDRILKIDSTQIDTNMNSIQKRWPDINTVRKTIQDNFSDEQVFKQVLEQSEAKYINAHELEKRLLKARSIWPDLKKSLKTQLVGVYAFQEMLIKAQAPSKSTHFGIDLKRLHKSYSQAQLIRKRYTILDFALESGCWNTCVDDLFQPEGFWFES